MTRRAAFRGPCFAGRPIVDPGAAGPFAEPEWPVFAFDRALGAIEQAFYRHVLRVIDLDALFGLEQLLWAELEERGSLSEEMVLDLSNAILSRALERIAHDPRRSMRPGVVGPGGRVVAAPEEPHEDCPFCAPDGAGGAGRAGRARRSGPAAGPAREDIS